MLKYLAVIVFAFVVTPLATVGVLCAQGAPEKGVAKGTGHDGQEQPTPSQTNQDSQCIPSHVAVIHPAPNDEAAQQAHENLKIQGDLALSTGLLVVVGFFQVGLLFWTWLAIKRQANHMETSERAWIIANVDTAPSAVDADVPVKIFPKFKNAGKTPAFLIEKSESSRELGSSASLPFEPIYPTPEKWEGNGVPLAPNDVLPIFLRSIEFDRTPREMFLHEKVFWIWGYIKYRDAFGNEGETRYCYKYEMVKASESTFEMIAWYLVGPTAYNRTE